QKMTFNFTETPFIEIVEFLSEMTRLKFELDPSLAGLADAKITLRRRDVTMRAAIDRVRELLPTRTALVVSPGRVKFVAAGDVPPSWERRSVEQLVRELEAETEIRSRL